jgi:hypothetical protein
LRKTVRRLLAASYPWREPPNRSYDRADFVELAALATARRQSLAHTSRENARLPDSDTLHLHLHDASPTQVFDAFQARLNELLALARVLHWLDEAVDVAIDRHNEPVYGEEQPWMVGMQEKAGTNLAHAYLTSQRLDEPRLTLDLELLNGIRHQTLALSDLLSQTLRRNPNLRSLLLDKGFYTANDLQLLLATGKDFIVPIPKTKATHKVEAELYRARTRVELGRSIAWRRHRVGGPRGPEIVQVIRWEPDADEPTGETWFAYACPRETTAEEFDAWATRYRTRWGIETGYRTLEDLRLRTTSHIYANRLWLTLTAILLDTAWRLLRHAHRKRGATAAYTLPQFHSQLQAEPVPAPA